MSRRDLYFAEGAGGVSPIRSVQLGASFLDDEFFKETTDPVEINDFMVEPRCD